MSAPEVVSPVLPDFGGACLTGVVPGLLGHLYGGGAAAGVDARAGGRAPTQIVLLVLDGLGWQQLEERPALAPTLAAGIGALHHLGRPQHDGVRA